MFKQILIGALLLAAVGCGKKTSSITTPIANTPSSGNAEPAHIATTKLTLSEGESFVPEADAESAPNPVTWRVSQDQSVELGIIFAGESARAVAAQPDGTMDVFGAVEFNYAYQLMYSVKAEDSGSAVILIQSMGGSGDPGFVQGWKLSWSTKNQKVFAEDSGYWDRMDDRPDWAHLPTN